jgi:hypothetical protein
VMVEKEKVTSDKGILSLDIKTAIGLLLKAIEKKIRKWSLRRIVTLDIDNTAIRILEVKSGKVRKWASVPIEPDKVEKGVVTDWKTLSTMTKELISSSGIKTKKVLASISGLYSISRIVPMSALPVGSTIQEGVLEVAREIMPLSEDRQYLSWQTFTDVNGVRHILLLGVLRDIIDAEVQSLRAVGINPYLLELKAMALARVVNKEKALILNLEPSSFDIIVTVNGVPEIMRTLPWQREEITAEDSVEHLAIHLESTVEFYNLHHSDTPLDSTTPIFITGQISKELLLEEKLQARIGYPIEPLASPLECPADLPFSQYAVNIGLALKEIVPSEYLGKGEYSSLNINALSKVNLLPDIYQPWKPTPRQLYASFFIIAALALLFPIYQVTSDTIARTAKLQTRYEAVNSILARMQTELSLREPLQIAINEYHTIVDMGGGFTKDIEAIESEAESRGIQVEYITHEGMVITMSCQADTHTAFREYLTALEENGRFSSPIPPPEGYPFTKGGIIKVEPKIEEPETNE